MPQTRRPDPTAMATGGTHIPWPPWATTLADDIRQLLPPGQRGPWRDKPNCSQSSLSPAWRRPGHTRRNRPISSTAKPTSRPSGELTAQPGDGPRETRVSAYPAARMLWHHLDRPAAPLYRLLRRRRDESVGAGHAASHTEGGRRREKEGRG